MQKESDMIKNLSSLQNKVDVDTTRLIGSMISETATVKHVCFHGNPLGGTSTLVNFFLGQNILPEGCGMRSTTNTIIHSSYSSTFEIKAKFFENSELKFYLNETLSNKSNDLSREYFEKFCQNGYTIKREFTSKDLDSICENFEPLPNEPLVIRDVFDFEQLKIKIKKLSKDFRISQIDIGAPFENLKQYPNLIFTDLPGASNPIKMISLIPKKWILNQHGEGMIFLVDETERLFNSDVDYNFHKTVLSYLKSDHSFKKALVVTKAYNMFGHRSWWDNNDPKKAFENDPEKALKNDPNLERKIDFFVTRVKKIVAKNIKEEKIVFVVDPKKKRPLSFECDLMSDFIFSSCQSTEQLSNKTNAIIPNLCEEKQPTKKMKLNV